MISVGFKTDKGMIRRDNEDSIFVFPDKQVYMVADGVGGQSSGELASRMTVGYMAQFVAIHPIPEDDENFSLRKYFTELFEGANKLVFDKATSEPQNIGMATTAVLCYLKDNLAYFVNVGDSRAYLVRDEKIYQITDDHSYVQTMYREGRLSKEEAEKHPDKNMITRAIGGDKTVNPDFFTIETYPGDIIIMCSDGLYGEVDQELMASLASRTLTMHKLASDLVEMANKHGGGDNISVVCIRI